MGLTVENVLLAIIFAIIAALYVAVGQAGGAGYIAVMGLLGLALTCCSPIAKPAKLLLPRHQERGRRHASLCNFALALQLRFPLF